MRIVKASLAACLVSACLTTGSNIGVPGVAPAGAEATNICFEKRKGAEIVAVIMQGNNAIELKR